MLIQITNCCHEGCRHCLQDSRPDGLHMTENTFKRAVAFGLFMKCRIFVISGGEPTEHPKLLEFCQYLNDAIKKSKEPAVFTICSNGTWYPEKSEIISKITKMKYFGGMQVYTNKKWYKDYDFIVENKENFEKFNRVTVLVDTPLYMQDLGRARKDEEAQNEIRKNPYHMSCINGHLLLKQISPVTKLSPYVSGGMMCKPVVDYRGNVHLSESWLCPSFGNVVEDFHKDIFENMRNSKPCMNCYLGKKFANENDLKSLQVKSILGI